MFYSFLRLVFFSIIAACSSMSDKVVSTMEEKNRPDWATQEKVITSRDGMLQILGFQELGVEAKISAAYRLSDNSARNELSKMMENQFSSILQNLEEGTEDNGNLARFYSSEVSKNILRDVKVVSRYWEKVQTIDSDGKKIFKLRVYSLAEISESNLRKLIKEKTAQAQIDPQVRNQVLNHFESEIKSLQTN